MADTKVEARDGFKSRWGFILACIGSAVGMGNIWRFPILVSDYGGLTFLLPYFVFVALIGASGVIEEFALGRAAGAGPVGAFAMCTGLKGKKGVGKALGFLPIIGSLGLSIGYTVVFAWICKYTFLAISGKLVAMGTALDPNVGVLHEFIVTAPEAYADFQLGGAATIWIVIAIIIAFAIMAAGVANGIEKANKVMMPVLFGLFIILGIYIAFLPGSSEGYKYIVTFNWPTETVVVDGIETVKNVSFAKIMIYAFGQAFFSLSVAGNGSVIYGSYLSKEEDVPSSARNVAIFDTLAALLAAFVIIPAMAAAGAELSSGGPGLMFIYLVSVINDMPAARIIGIVFFVAVLFAGLSSIINLYEAPVALLQEEFKVKRIPAVAIMLGFGAIVAIFIQPITSQWMDVVSIYICPLGALLAGIMFFWVGGKKFALDQVNTGAKKPIGKWFYPLGKYVYCACALIALIAGAALGGIG